LFVGLFLFWQSIAPENGPSVPALKTTPVPPNAHSRPHHEYVRNLGGINQENHPTMITTTKLTDRRVTVRLSEEDEAALKIVQTKLRSKFPSLNKADLVRAAIHEGALALSGIIGA
jgi:hypothetical protein